jgi:hypothetical protein
MESRKYNGLGKEFRRSDDYIIEMIVLERRRNANS